MSSSVLLTALFALHLAMGERETQTVCAGREFRLPVYSTSREVVFTSDPEGLRRVLLHKTTVKDPRFEWTRDKMLVLREVTHADQGLYSIKLASGFTYEMVRLTVSECIKSYHRSYGQKFEVSIPENGSVLEFSPWGAPPESMPVVLWNQTHPDPNDVRQGQLLQGGSVWVLERVTKAYQGNYTVRDVKGKVLSRSTLNVRGHSFNVSRFTKGSLNLPLFLPVDHANLIFTPTRYHDDSSLDPQPPHGPVELIHAGYITEQDMRYRGLISLGRNGSMMEVVIVRLTLRHEGVYEIKDTDGNLVSTTRLQVIDKGGKWRALFKSMTVPSGMFLSLAGLYLFIKRYPTCSMSRILVGLRSNRSRAANPPRVNIQDYSQSSPQPAGNYSHLQRPGTPRKCSPRSSPAHTGYSRVVAGSPRAENQRANGSTERNSPHHRATTERDTIPNNEEDRRICFPVAGAPDCLHSSEDCVQFQIKTCSHKDRWKKSQGNLSTLPLDRDTSESCSVYTSDKLNFS